MRQLEIYALLRNFILKNGKNLLPKSMQKMQTQSKTTLDGGRLNKILSQI